MMDSLKLQKVKWTRDDYLRSVNDNDKWLMIIDLRRPRGSKDAYERAMIDDSLSLNHRRRRESKDVSRGPRGAGDASLASDDHHTAKVDGRARLGDRAGGGPSDSLLVKNDS